MKIFIKTIILLFFSLPTVSWATDHYVRPIGGSYGLEDGSDYDNAWDGLLNVQWGEGVGEVGSGDTLYVCGVHLHPMTSQNYAVTQADISITSGSEGSPIIIRGDYSGESGIIWGHYKMSYDSWVDEGSNTYSYGWWSSTTTNQFIVEDITSTSHTLLDPKTSVDDCKANAGSFYADNENGKIYVHCTDNGDPTGRIAGPLWGYDFLLSGKSYITFRNLEIYGPYRWIGSVDGEYCDHITFEGCKIYYGQNTFNEKSNNIVFDGNEIAWQQSGICWLYNSNEEETSGNVFTRNVIHDIGVRAVTQNSDAEGMGIQPGVGGFTITYNEFYNCGVGITLWSYTFPYSDIVIGYNYIRDGHGYSSARSIGIELNIDSDPTGNMNNIIVHHNIIRDMVDWLIDNQITGVTATTTQDSTTVTVSDSSGLFVGATCNITGVTFDSSTEGIVTEVTDATHIEMNNACDQSVSDASIVLVVGGIEGGIKVKIPYPVSVYNNVVSNCKHNYYYVRGAATNGIKILNKNNISLSPIDNHLYFADSTHEAGIGDSNCYINSDSNIFYPISDTQFYFYDSGGAHDVNYSDWQSLSHTGCTYDPNSFASDPKLNDPENEDFTLQPDSPAINGTDLGDGSTYGVLNPSSQWPNAVGVLNPDHFGWPIGAYPYLEVSGTIIGNGE